MSPLTRRLPCLLIAGLFAAVFAAAVPDEPTANETDDAPTASDRALHREARDQDPLPPPMLRAGAHGILRGLDAIQVNVDKNGDNIVGDAANEPSIAVDPTNPNRIVIGWRQFDTVKSNFRQGGWAYSRNAGRSWTFPGVLEKNVFRSDPVLAADAEGDFYYNSLTDSFLCDVFKSVDGGRTWAQKIPAFGGDKQWMTIDLTDGIGRDNIYCFWSRDYSCCGANIFTRSTDGGDSFQDPVPIPSSPRWGTLAVAYDGTVYAGGRTDSYNQLVISRSTNAQDPAQTPKFEKAVTVDLGGGMNGWGGPNPEGLLGQVWVACDHSDGQTRGYVYFLCSVTPSGGSDPLDVRFARSTDGGKSWSKSIRINDDSAGTNAYQWFGTMSVAPNGRIDVVWNDTRDDEHPSNPTYSVLYYSYSIDGGDTWSANVPLTPAWNHFLGYPQQQKIGDYYHMISDNVGANLAFAATFNDEQDVWFLRIGDYDCNGNGVGDTTDLADGTSTDLNGNGIPDECDGLGDLNCDGQTDFNDIDAFVLALSNPADYAAQYPNCDILHGDINGDGSVDFNDIDGFVLLLTR